jgi:hypothetical protein
MTDFARPTIYSGITFRSRLEATWAAFFDIVEWAWEYEPDGFDGYIPDFILHGSKNDVFVEVKPSSLYHSTRAQIVSKARRAIGYKPDLLILCDSFEKGEDPDTIVLWYMPPADDDDPYSKGDEQALLCTGCADFGHGVGYDFRHTWGSWIFRLSGVYEGNAHFFDVEASDFYKLWSRARNKFQWMPKHDAA